MKAAVIVKVKRTMLQIARGKKLLVVHWPEQTEKKKQMDTFLFNINMQSIKGDYAIRQWKQLKLDGSRRLSRNTPDATTINRNCLRNYKSRRRERKLTLMELYSAATDVYNPIQNLELHRIWQMAC